MWRAKNGSASVFALKVAALRSDGTDRDFVSTAEVREALNAIYN